MKAKLIQIGNSKGFRLPKAMIKKFEFFEEFEITESEEGLFIRPIDTTRKGWDEQFKLANASDVSDDDFSDFLDTTTNFEEKEWEW